MKTEKMRVGWTLRENAGDRDNFSGCVTGKICELDGRRFLDLNEVQ